MSTKRYDTGVGMMTFKDVDNGYQNVVDGMSRMNGKRIVVGWFDNISLPGSDSSVLRMAVLSEFGSNSGNIIASAPLRGMFDENDDFFMNLLGRKLYDRLVRGERVDVVLNDISRTALEKLKERMSGQSQAVQSVEGSATINKKSREILEKLSEMAESRVE